MKDVNTLKSAIGNNDNLDENKLLIEEKSLNDLMNRLTTEEELYLKQIMKDVDDEINKITGLVIKMPATQPKLKTKKIKKTNAPQALASKSVSNPVYTTYAQFESEYMKALAEQQAKTKVFKIFKAKAMKDVNTLKSAIGNKWKNIRN